MKNLFVLGDSISIHYGSYLERYLEGYFEYSRKGYSSVRSSDLNDVSNINGGDSSHCLEYLTGNVDLRCDVLLLNCGLHDIKTTDTIQVSAEIYEKNLREIVSLISSRGIKAIWVTSTPVDDTVHNERSEHVKRYSKDLLLYCEIAKRVMSENDIPIIDLHTFTKRLGGKEIYIDHVHFTEPIRQLQAAFIAGHLFGINMAV